MLQVRRGKESMIPALLHSNWRYQYERMDFNMYTDRHGNEHVYACVG